MAFPPNVTGQTGITQRTNLTIEGSPGEQLLLVLTPGAASMGVTLNPNQVGMTTTGAHLHFIILGNAGAGTVQVAGTTPAGGGLTSALYHVNAAPLNAQGYSEFTTSEVFATVTAASGITLSAGLLPCSVLVFACPAGKYLIPVELDSMEEHAKTSPTDRRGILWPTFRVQQLARWVTLSKFDCSVYADSLWALYMLVTNNPTITTVPATPAVLLAATAKGATMTLAAGPSAPGMFFIFTPAGNSVAGTIVLTGKDLYGNPYATSETLNVGANNNVVYSARRYSSINVGGTPNEFATTGLSAGATLAVGGVFAWTYTGTWDGVTNTTKSTATLEHFDGVDGLLMPSTFFTDGTFTWEKEKEILFSAKGEAQDYLLVGDPNPPGGYPAGVNPFALLAQPTTMPMPGWSTQFWLDALPGGVPFTTQDGSLLTFKVQINTGLKSYFVGDGMQRWSDTTYGAEPDCAVEATFVYQNPGYYETWFKPNAKYALAVTFQGTLLGSITGQGTFFENISFVFPVRLDTYAVDRSKDPVEAMAKFFTEYDFLTLGYAFRMSMTCQQPPVYTQ